MAASFPAAAKSFTTKVDGQDRYLAAHINDLQLEVAATEQLLLGTGVLADKGAAFFASNPPTGAYGTKTNAIVRPMGLNISTYAGYDGSGATVSDSALSAIIADLPSGGGQIYAPVGNAKFQAQVTLPVGFALSVKGDGKMATKWQYTGVTQQPWLIFPGQNQGTSFREIGIGGFPADPLIQILSSTGSGTNGYNSEFTFDGCSIGALFGPAFVPPAPSIAYRGLQAQADVFRANDTEFYGRNIGIQFDLGTSDWWLINCNTSVLPQASEPSQIGIFCNTTGLPFGGSGHLINCLLSAAGATTTVALLRSVVDVISCHCESGHLPFDLRSGKFQILGGTFNGDATATTIIQAAGSSGKIAPANFSKTTALVNFVNIGTSSGAWDLDFPDAGTVPGGLPATPIVCDWIGRLNFPGYFPNPSLYSSIAAPTMQTGLVGAANSIVSMFTVNDGAKHFFRVTFQVTVTTHGTESFNAQVAYTDSNGTARTLTVPMTNTAGTTSIAISGAADSFVGVATIACNPNTALTLKTAGSFAGCTYNVGGQVAQIA